MWETTAKKMWETTAKNGTRDRHAGTRDRPGTGRAGRERRADTGGGPHRPARRRIRPAGDRTRRGHPDRGRGHPPGPLARGQPEHRAQGAGGLLLRRGRDAAHAGPARGGPGHPAHHRRGHPGHQRPGLPAGGRRGRGRAAGDGAARAVGGDDRAGRLRAAHRPVLLRGLPAPGQGPAGQPVRRARRRRPHPGLLRVRPQGGRHAGRARRLARRGPPGGGVPRAHQDPRGDRPRHAGRAGRVGGRLGRRLRHRPR
jgi:hypothetical protein